MMFEFNIKPRVINYETRTFKGKWIPMSRVEYNHPPTPEEVEATLNLTDKFGYGARAISSRGSQIMSTRALELYDYLSIANLVSVVEKAEDSHLLFSQNNKFFSSYEELQRIFIDHKGIDRATRWADTEHDGNLLCFGVTMNDGTKFTIACYF